MTGSFLFQTNSQSVFLWRMTVLRAKQKFMYIFIDSCVSCTERVFQEIKEVIEFFYCL